MAKTKTTKLSSPLFPRDISEITTEELKKSSKQYKAGDFTKKQQRTNRRWVMMFVLNEMGLIKSYVDKSTGYRLTLKDVKNVINSKKAIKLHEKIKKNFNGYLPNEDFNEFVIDDAKEEKKKAKKETANILEGITPEQLAQIKAILG